MLWVGAGSLNLDPNRLYSLSAPGGGEGRGGWGIASVPPHPPSASRWVPPSPPAGRRGKSRRCAPARAWSSSSPSPRDRRQLRRRHARGLSRQHVSADGGTLRPAGLLARLSPWWRNFFENLVAVQFDHRVLAETTLVARSRCGSPRCGGARPADPAGAPSSPRWPSFRSGSASRRCSWSWPCPWRCCIRPAPWASSRRRSSCAMACAARRGYDLTMADSPEKTLADWQALAAKELGGKTVDGSPVADARGHRGQAALYGGRPRGARAAPVAAGLPALPARRARHHVCRPALDHPPICRLLDRRGIQPLLPRESGGRADGPVGRLRSRHPSRLRQRPSARRRRCRQGRRRDRLASRT